jgi:hypothetical protein
VIALAPWQEKITGEHPALLLRGLIHSDGCRVLNRVNGAVYPRYLFSNKSEGIRQILEAACVCYGIRYTRSRHDVRSVARKKDVARLDAIIGPKA